jgi:hypothetical protein
MFNLRWQDSFVSTPIISIELLEVGLSFSVDNQLLDECIGMLAHTGSKTQATGGGKTQANPTVPHV